MRIGSEGEGTSRRRIAGREAGHGVAVVGYF